MIYDVVDSPVCPVGYGWSATLGRCAPLAGTGALGACDYLMRTPNESADAYAARKAACAAKESGGGSGGGTSPFGLSTGMMVAVAAGVVGIGVLVWYGLKG